MTHGHPQQRSLTRARALTRRTLLRTPLLLLPAAVSLSAQTRQEKGRQLMEQCLEALGGHRFLQIQDIVQYGRAYAFYRQNIRGLAKMTVYQHFGPMKEDYFNLYRNGEGWEVTFRGARPLPSERISRYREAARRDIFYFLRYRLNEPGMYFYYRGAEIIDNIPADVVEVTDNNSEGITFFLGRSDQLPLQQIHTWRDPKGVPFEEKSVFSKYRPVGGVKFPWNIRSERDGEKRFELFGRTVEIDPVLDPAVYSLDKTVPILAEAP